MTLREELQDRADQLDAELLELSGRMKEIERQSDDVHTCINALDIAEMDAEDAALEPIPTPEEIGSALDEIEAAEAAEAKLLEAEPEPSLFDAMSATEQEVLIDQIITNLDEPTEPEPSVDELLSEIDAEPSVMDDPELQAAVARAEATLAAEPAYIGLQDADLDAEWDAMKAREEAEKPKPRFSIFGRIKEDA